MTPNTRSLEERLSAEEILRGWASAYRDGPAEYRFPCDPHAEFFPVDMEIVAAALAAKDRLLVEARDALETLSKGDWVYQIQPIAAAMIIIRTTLANLKAEMEGKE